MRRFILIGFLVVIGFMSQSQSLHTILKNHFDAYGQELWDQVNTVVIDGEWVTSEFQKFPMKLTYKYPNKVRIEGTWGSKKYAEVTDGKIAWTLAPWTSSSKPKYMDPLEHLIIDNIYRKGSPLKPYEKSLKLEGLELYETELLIKLIYEDENYTRTFFLGKEDYVLYWEVVKSKVGMRYEIRKQFEKYKNYNGLLSPTSVRVYSLKGQREYIFDDVALGVGAANSLFEMPKSH